MGEGLTRLGVGLVAGGIGFAAGYAVGVNRLAGDEERPPIIVRGGSLIFQSGDPDSSEQEERLGKAWHQVGSDWQPNHADGRSVKRFYVAIRGGTPEICPGLSLTKEVRLTYSGPDGDKEFTITMRPEKQGGGPGSPQAPAIIGDLTPGPATAQNPQLVHGTPGQGSIKSVRFQGLGTGNVNCPAPSSLKVWQE